MSKEKLENDYQTFNQQIEKLTEEAIRNIREKAEAVKEEAAKKGQEVELALKQEKNGEEKA